MGIYTLDSGKEMELFTLKMETNTQDSGKIAKLMEKERVSIEMEINMKDSGKMAEKMEMELFAKEMIR